MCLCYLLWLFSVCFGLLQLIACFVSVDSFVYFQITAFGFVDLVVSLTLTCCLVLVWVFCLLVLFACWCFWLCNCASITGLVSLGFVLLGFVLDLLVVVYFVLLLFAVACWFTCYCVSVAVFICSWWGYCGCVFVVGITCALVVVGLLLFCLLFIIVCDRFDFAWCFCVCCRFSTCLWKLFVLRLWYDLVALYCGCWMVVDVVYSVEVGLFVDLYCWFTNLSWLLCVLHFVAVVLLTYILVVFGFGVWLDSEAKLFPLAFIV